MRLPPRLVLACILTTAALRADPPPETTITSTGRMETVSTDIETTTTFHDNVVVVGNGIKLTCDFLKTVVARKGDVTATVGQFGAFKSILATGHVYILQGDREATCGRAEFLPEQDLILLTENPLVRYLADKSTITGGRITIRRGQRIVYVDPDATHTVHATLPPLKDLGFDKTAPGATPAPPAQAPAGTGDK
jgi:lipopolysaccharide export system protein LptA